MGERRDRRLRVWVEGKCRDQEWQFNNQDEFKEAGEVAKEGQGNEVRTPRVEFEIKGKVLDVRRSLSHSLLLSRLLNLCSL